MAATCGVVAELKRKEIGILILIPWCRSPNRSVLYGTANFMCISSSLLVDICRSFSFYLLFIFGPSKRLIDQNIINIKNKIIIIFFLI